MPRLLLTFALALVLLGCARQVPIAEPAKDDQPAAPLDKHLLNADQQVKTPAPATTATEKTQQAQPTTQPEPLQKLLVGPELEKPVPVNYLRVSAEEVSWATSSNDESERHKYDNKPVQIEGVVKTIGIDERGKFVMFYTTLPTPFYVFNTEALRQVEKIKPGDKVGLRAPHGVSP